MKYKIIGLLCIVVLLFSLSACSEKVNARSSSATAKELLNLLYNVDSQTTQTFNLPVVSASSSSLGVYSIPEPNAFTQLNEKFKNILTEKEYSAFTSSNTYLNYVKVCKDNNIVITPSDIQINQTSYEKNLYNYDYKASIKVTYTKDNNSKTENEAGQLDVIKVNNTWKINYFCIYQSDILKSSY